MTDSTPWPGDYILVTSKDSLISAGIRWATQAPVSHTAIYTDPGRCVEAEPDGVRYSTPPAGILVRHPELTDTQRAAIAAAARGMIGVGYGWADILACALAQRRFGSRIDPHTPYSQQPWWVRRLVDPSTLICSQLVTEAYERAGLLLVPGMLAALVTPGDLWRHRNDPAVPAAVTS